MKTLCHISDPHFGTEDPAIAAGLLKDLAALQPDVVALSGDLTQRAKPEQFQAARAFLDQLRMPYIVVPGNHDVPLYDVFRRLFRTLTRYRRYITEDLAPTYFDGELAVVGVNTAHAMTVKDGKITPEQTAVACAQLTTSGNPWKILVAHHPFVVPDDHKEDLVEGAAAALPQLEDAGVEVILTGHLHVPFNSDMGFRTPDRKIVSVHAGTCMSTRLRGEPNSYNRLGFEGNRLTITLRLWDGTRFGDGDSKVYERRGVNGPNEQFARLQ